jgi:DNA-binding response OmpR family regulator
MDLGRKTLIVVEDDPDIGLLLVRALEDDGYTVSLVADGETALAQIRRSRPDLVVLDLKLPRLDGFAVLRELRIDGTVPGMPVVVVSALSGLDSQTYALALGAVAAISKPFDLERFLETTRRILAHEVRA